MAKTRKIQLSFAGGEIDPQMYGRIDMQQYQSGLATCKNWIVDPRGSLTRRPGFQRVASSVDSSRKSRVIPFTYSVDQQLAVELTHEKLRLHAGGGTVVWSALKEFDRGGVDTSGNKITFLETHGFEEGEQIVFFAQSASEPSSIPSYSFLPAPFSAYNWSSPGPRPDGEYYVRLVDSKTIQVFDNATGGSVVSITSTGTPNKKLYAFSRGSVDRDTYASSSQAKKYVGPARIYRGWSRSTASSGRSWWRGQAAGSQYCLDFTGGVDPTLSGFHQGEKVQLVTEDPANAGVAIPLPGIPTILYVDYFGGGSIPCGSYQFGLRTKKEYVGTVAGGGSDTFVSAAVIQSARLQSGYSNVWIRQYWEKGDLLYFDPDVMGGSGSLALFDNRIARVTSDFGSAWTGTGQTQFFLNSVAESVVDLEDDGSFSIASPYSDSEIFDVEYDQSGDVVTLTHPNHPPHDLIRFDSLKWTLSPISLAPVLDPPSSLNSVIQRGSRFLITDFETAGSPSDTTIFIIDDEKGAHPFAIGDTVYIEVGQANANVGLTVSGYYMVAEVIGGTNTTGSSKFSLRSTLNGELITASSTGVSGTLTGWAVYYSVASAETTERYKVTSVDSRNQESFASEEEEVNDNVLSVAGASNTISWEAAPPASSYNIYKRINGIFGFVGQVDKELGEIVYSFEDDNIGPDLAQTLLIPDADVEDSYQPRASARFEQRRCFGGSDALPRTLFMSRSGTESSFSYRFPTQADDRISVDMASREAHVIRHIVPVQDLLLMTQQGEFRVTAINSDAITADTIAIRQQSYIGSNHVHPQVVNNTVVFCSARGGHAREMNFQAESQSYLTGDLSLRAGHLFDGFTLNDLAYSKAPIPILWFVSSSGKLLCLTYLPEERILAWHQHETDGAIESVCSISEGNFDNLYVVVKRGDERSIERLVQSRRESLENSVYLDASVKHDGTNTGPFRLGISSLGLYKSGDSVTVDAYDDDSADPKKGLFAKIDESSIVEFSSGGSKCRVSFDTYVSETQFAGTLLSDLPDDLKNAPTTNWAFGYKTFSGFSHLASQSIQVLIDGKTEKTVTVSADGTITLADHAVKVCGGIPFTSRAKTLPLSLETEAGAQGRTKSVNQIFVRVDNSGALKVGVDESDLKSVTELKDDTLQSGEFQTSVPSTWNPEGDIVIEASGASPATVLNITAQVSLGD